MWTERCPRGRGGKGIGQIQGVMAGGGIVNLGVSKLELLMACSFI